MPARTVNSDRQRGPRLLRGLAPGISWAVAAGFVTWAAARVTATDRLDRVGALITPPLSFTPQVTVVAPLAALGLGVVSQRGPAATTALAAVALAAVTRPRATRRPQPAARGPVLRLLTVNVLCGRADPAALVALVRRTSADVLFLQELTAEAVTGLTQAGLDDLLPEKITDLRGNSRSLGSGLYARYPLRPIPPLAQSQAAQPAAVLELPGGEALELSCVHLRAPIPMSSRGVAQWRRELAALPPTGKLPRVLAGDFNATLDHAPLRSVLRRGYADAAGETGRALIPTWGPLNRPAVITIDHVLVDRRCAVRASSVHAVPGTDHRGVYVEVQLPGE